MPLQKFEEFLFDVVSINDHPSYSRWPPDIKIAWCARELCDGYVRYSLGVGEQDQSTLAEIQRAIEAFVERYIIPIDITGMPVLERMIDNKTRLLLPPALTQALAEVMHRRLHPQGGS